MRYLLALLLACVPAWGAQLISNTGSAANDGTGDTLRTHGNKSNTNFTEIYTQVGTNSQVLFYGQTNSFFKSGKVLTAGNNITLTTNGNQLVITGEAGGGGGGSGEWNDFSNATSDGNITLSDFVTSWLSSHPGGTGSSVFSLGNNEPSPSEEITLWRLDFNNANDDANATYLSGWDGNGSLVYKLGQTDFIVGEFVDVRQSAVYNDALVITNSIRIPNSPTPTTDLPGEIGFDNDAWASGRGAIQAWDGTVETYVLSVQASDTPVNGQVPKFNSDGTITWENDATGGGGGGSAAYVNGAPITDPNFATGTMAVLQVAASTNITVWPTNLTAAQLVTDSVSADELNAAGVESELEAVVDLQDLQGAVTDAQVPNTITIDLATTATTANAGDSATAFFPAGTIERVRGGTGADTSGFGIGLFGSDAGNATIDVDTISELETAVASVNIIISTEIDTSAELAAILPDESGTGNFLLSTKPIITNAIPFDSWATLDTEIDWDASATLLKTLSSSPAITFVNATDGQRVELVLKQDATGGRVPTWPAGLIWWNSTNQSTTSPALNTNANALNFISLFRLAGTNYAMGPSSGDSTNLTWVSALPASASKAVGWDPSGTYLTNITVAGAVSWDGIGDASADGSISLAGFETDFAASLDSSGKAVFTWQNQDADRAADTIILDLGDYDTADDNAIYLRARADVDGTPVNDYILSQTEFRVGTAITVNIGGTLNANNINSTNDFNVAGDITADEMIITNVLRIPNAAAPTTDAFGEIAGDNNAWASGRGAVQAFDGTANTWLVGVLSSDTPSNGQVPKWNTGGTITWEDDGGAGSGDPVLIDGVGVSDGSGVDFIGGAGVDYTFAAGASPDTATAAVDATELNDLTWGDNSDATIQWTFNGSTGTDPVLQIGNGNFNLSTGALQEGGNAVFNSSETPGGELGGTWASPTVDDTLTVDSWTFTGAPGIALNNGATGAGSFRVVEDSDAGSNYTEFRGTNLAANVIYVLPPDDGTSGQQLTTDGDGLLTWAAAGGGGVSDGDKGDITVSASGATWTVDTDAVLWNEIGDSGGDTTIAMGANNSTITASIDSANDFILNIQNQDADTGADTYNLKLESFDSADANVVYLIAQGNVDDVAVVDYTMSQTAFTIGSGVTTDFNGPVTIEDLSVVDDFDVAGDLSVGSLVVTNQVDVLVVKDLWTTNGSTGAGRMFFPEDTDNGTSKLTLAAQASQASDKTITFPDATGTVVLQDDTATLTGKTLDAAGSGNTIKTKKYITLKQPDRVVTSVNFNTNDVSVNTFMRPIFDDATDQASNYIEWWLEVPDDIDTSVDLRGRVSFELTGADTAAHRYVLSHDDVAASASVAGSQGNSVNLDFAGDASGASGDVEQVAFATLTSWAANVTAGRVWVIRLARDGDTSDASTVDSRFISVTIEYGTTQ